MPIQYILWLSFLNRQIHLEFGKPAKHEGVEAQWMGYNGKMRLMDNNTKTVVGDSIGLILLINLIKEKQLRSK
jgi:hypothetical protein